MTPHPRIVATALCLCIGLPLMAQAVKVDIESKGLKLSVPKHWLKKQPSSQMRVFQFDIPSAKAGEDKAELVIYNFGGPTGGIKANLERWVGQFKDEGRKHTTVKGQSAQGEYVLVNITGTWKKPDGPPFARKTVDTPNSRVLGVILVKKGAGKPQYFFFKLGGPEGLVAKQAKALRESFGAKAGTEKDFKP